MDTDKVLILARKHLGNGAAMESSARFCMEDAMLHVAMGDLDSAKVRALKSLAYSVGIFHPDYKRAAS